MVSKTLEKEEIKEIIDEKNIESLRNAEIEELEGLFEDEGEPQYQFAKIFFTADKKNINFIFRGSKRQLISMPKVEIGENMIIDEFGLEENDLMLEELVFIIKQESVSLNGEGRKERIRFIGKNEDTKKKGLLKALGIGG